MRRLTVLVLSAFFLAGDRVPAQGVPRAPSDSADAAALLPKLDAAEAEMWRVMAAGDAAGFDRITGSDYQTINADGAWLDRAAAKAIIGKFTGVEAVVSDRQRRLYGNTALITGQAGFTVSGLLVAKIYFTQVWVWRDNRWQFINWQGTMTGAPTWYPVVLTALGMLALFALVELVRRRRAASA
jgi:hypothetical protein